jgi:hypothetical protein
MIIDAQLKSKLVHFVSPEGAAALEDLGQALYAYYAKQCTMNEDKQVYRDQGAAQLAAFLINLPQVLRNGNATHN